MRGTTVTAATAQASPTRPDSSPGGLVPIATADVDGDGDADILRRNPSTGAVVIDVMQSGTSTGTHSPRSSSGLDRSPGTEWDIVGTGRLDSGNTSDIVWRNSSTGEVVIWLMQGTVVQTGDYARNTNGTLRSPGAQWEVQTIDDFDGNGVSDILWRHATSGELATWTVAGTSVVGGDYVRSAGGTVRNPGFLWDVVPL